MNREQKFDDPESAHRATQDGLQAKIWTCLPGIVESWDADAGTVVVQPAIQGLVTGSNDVRSPVNIGLLLDVPVQFPSSGGVTFTFPIKKGDEVLVHFSARCHDAWWQQGGVQPQADLRMHDLSDGFAVPGLRSQPRKLTGVSTTAAQMRTDDGQHFIQIDPAAGTISFTSSNVVTFNCPAGLKVVGGGVVADGEGTFNGGHTVSQHQHADPQGGTVAKPTG